MAQTWLIASNPPEITNKGYFWQPERSRSILGKSDGGRLVEMLAGFRGRHGRVRADASIREEGRIYLKAYQAD